MVFMLCSLGSCFRVIGGLSGCGFRPGALPSTKGAPGLSIFNLGFHTKTWWKKGCVGFKKCGKNTFPPLPTSPNPINWICLVRSSPVWEVTKTLSAGVLVLTRLVERVWVSTSKCLSLSLGSACLTFLMCDLEQFIYPSAPSFFIFKWGHKSDLYHRMLSRLTVTP